MEVKVAALLSSTHLTDFLAIPTAMLGGGCFFLVSLYSRCNTSDGLPNGLEGQKLAQLAIASNDFVGPANSYSNAHTAYSKKKKKKVAHLHTFI